MAAAIAALGGSVSLAAKVGADPFGTRLVRTMQSFGVSTELMLQAPDHFTTIAFVSLMENGERDFHFNRGADGELSLEEIENICLDDFSIVHFGSATAFLPAPLQKAYHRLLDRALEKGLFVSFDPNYRHLLFRDDPGTFIEQSWKFLDACRFVKLSEEEAQMITGQQSLEGAAATLFNRTDAVFAITLGARGAMLGQGGDTSIIQGSAVMPVDTTGAGDAFTGAVLYQLALHTPVELSALSREVWERIVDNANRAGARTCEQLGAMEAFRELNARIFTSPPSQ